MYTSVRLCWVALAALIDLPRVRHRGVARAAPRHVLGGVLGAPGGDVSTAGPVFWVVECRLHRSVANVAPTRNALSVSIAFGAADRAPCCSHEVLLSIEVDHLSVTCSDSRYRLPCENQKQDCPDSHGSVPLLQSQPKGMYFQ